MRAMSIFVDVFLFLLFFSANAVPHPRGPPLEKIWYTQLQVSSKVYDKKLTVRHRLVAAVYAVS
jgi:hypothetical protein